MYQETINQINKVSAATKSAIARKSAQTLPINPSEKGYPAEEIKRRFYQPITDSVNSALSEIDRVVEEVNATNTQIKNNMDVFIEQSLIIEPYKINLTDRWELNEDTGMFEVTILADEHGIKRHDELGVDMYLLDGQGKYTSVNQFEVLPDASVRLFHETNGAGYASIYIKREGYIESVRVIGAENVIGLAKVAISNSFKDLDDAPNLDIMIDNEEMISKMIAGTQPVYQALNADKAKESEYAATSGTADFATNTKSADKALADQYGVNIDGGYCKKNGSYADLRAGIATRADNAYADEDGVNIKSQYAKQSGEYLDMVVGNANKAKNADNATLASKATADSNGNKIVETYATKTGTYSSMTVGNAKKAESAESATKAQYVQIVTTAPTAAPPANCLVIAYLNVMPSTRYDRVLYLVGD